MTDKSRADIDSDLLVEFKKQEIAVHLINLIHHKDISRAGLARLLGWTPSRITKILSGSENMTVETLSRIHQALDVDFDLVSRPTGKARARQMWDRAPLNVVSGGFNGLPRRRPMGAVWQMQGTVRAANDAREVGDGQVTRQLA